MDLEGVDVVMLDLGWLGARLTGDATSQRVNAMLYCLTGWRWGWKRASCQWDGVQA